MGRRIRKEDYIKAIRASNGIITSAAMKLGVERAAIYQAAKRWSDVQEAIDESRQILVDFAEAKLKEKILALDTTAIIFTLKTLGKNRGYVERVEQQHSGEIAIRPIAIEVVPPDDA